MSEPYGRLQIRQMTCLLDSSHEVNENFLRRAIGTFELVHARATEIRPSSYCCIVLGEPVLAHRSQQQSRRL